MTVTNSPRLFTGKGQGCCFDFEDRRSDFFSQENRFDHGALRRRENRRAEADVRDWSRRGEREDLKSDPGLKKSNRLIKLQEQMIGRGEGGTEQARSGILNL